MRNSIADSIVSIRKKHGLSQEQFAEKVNVSRKAVSNWERGVAVPDVATLDRIANLFETDLTSLVSGITESENKEKNSNSKYLQGLLFTGVLLLLAHIVLGLLGYVKMLSVVLLPGVIVGLAIMLHFIFQHIIAQSAYSIMAGYDRQKDDVNLVKKQLTTIELLNLVFVLFFNILFFVAYTLQESSQHLYSIALLGYYILIFLIIVVGVYVKMKSR